MSQKLGYWVDLSTIQLSEGDKPSSWIHAMGVGKYQHAVYGEIAFTEDRIKRFAEGVKTRIRGIDPDIDYDHKMHSGEAAGWVKAADARPDGLWLFVEWTARAAQKIREREYRYFSPEFLDEWTDAQGATHPDVLNGGAITNRPFLKDLVPLNLSEFSLSVPPEEPERKDMDTKVLSELLGLSSDATEDQITAKLKELKEKPAPPPPVTPEDELKKLAETNPIIKDLVERTRANEVALRLAEVSNQMVALTEFARQEKVTFPAAIDDPLRKLLTEAGPKVGDQVLELLKTVAKSGMVKLGEEGHQRTGSTDTDPVKAFTDKVAQFQKDNPKVPYIDAVKQVTLAEPEAYRAYAHASYGAQV